MANLLYFKDIAEMSDVRIAMETSKEHDFHVLLPSKHVFKFSECGKGLYYLDTKDLTNNNKSKVSINTYPVLQTVNSNTEYFTAQ